MGVSRSRGFSRGRLLGSWNAALLATLQIMLSAAAAPTASNWYTSAPLPVPSSTPCVRPHLRDSLSHSNRARSEGVSGFGCYVVSLLLGGNMPKGVWVGYLSVPAS